MSKFFHKTSLRQVLKNKLETRQRLSIKTIETIEPIATIENDSLTEYLNGKVLNETDIVAIYKKMMNMIAMFSLINDDNHMVIDMFNQTMELYPSVLNSNIFNTEFFEQLRRNGVYNDKINGSNPFLFYFVMVIRNMSQLRCLMELEPDFTIMNEYGQSALIIAVKYMPPNMIIELLNSSVILQSHINSIDVDGLTSMAYMFNRFYYVDDLTITRKERDSAKHGLHELMNAFVYKYNADINFTTLVIDVDDNMELMPAKYFLQAVGLTNGLHILTAYGAKLDEHEAAYYRSRFEPSSLED